MNDSRSARFYLNSMWQVKYHARTLGTLYWLFKICETAFIHGLYFDVFSSFFFFLFNIRLICIRIFEDKCTVFSTNLNTNKCSFAKYLLTGVHAIHIFDCDYSLFTLVLRLCDWSHKSLENLFIFSDFIL